MVGKDGKVLVAKDKRITARTLRELQDAGMKRILVPADNVLGRMLGEAVVNKDTGEILAPANAEIPGPGSPSRRGAGTIAAGVRGGQEA